MFKVLIIFFLLLQTSNRNIINVIINPEKDKDSIFLLSELASDIKYIKLQTNETCMVSDVIKVLIDGESLFVVTRKGTYSRLLQFNLNGTFINEIGTFGRGPGEYSTVLDFTLDKPRNTVYLMDTMGKILVYDYTGHFLKAYKLDSRPTSLVYKDDALYLFTAWPDYYLNNGYGITIKQLTNNKADKYLLNRKYLDVKRIQGVIVYPNYFYGINTTESISFLEAKFDTLYSIDSDYKIEPKLILNLINDMPRDLVTSEEYNFAYKTHNTLFNILEVKNYIFFTVMTSKPMTTYFYKVNSLTGELKKHNVTKDKKYINNDVDGGLPFNPQGIADKGIMYSSVDCYKLKDYLDKNKPSNSIRSKKIEELKRLVRDSDLSDNPIIMLVNIK